MPLSVTLNPLITGALTKTLNSGKSLSYALPSGKKKTFTNGSGANQVSKYFEDTRTISGSSSENLDLSGSLTNVLGEAVVFAKVKAIYIYNHADSSGNLTVGAAALNAFVGPFADATDAIVLPPDSFIMLSVPTAAGMAVTATTADLLKVANGGAGSSTYDVMIFGA